MNTDAKIHDKNLGKIMHIGYPLWCAERGFIVGKWWTRAMFKYLSSRDFTVNIISDYKE